jgi:hypothetical protein
LAGQRLINGDKTTDFHFYAREDDPFLKEVFWYKKAVEVIVSAEVKRGCQWLVSKDECEVVFKKPVNDCDTKGADHQHGGTLENDCLYIRIDPNVRVIRPG